MYAATVVLYRTFTFNNCEEAAAELQEVQFINRYTVKNMNKIISILGY